MLPEELKNVHVATIRLKQLLDDPQPGLAMWCWAAAKAMRELKEALAQIDLD